MNYSKEFTEIIREKIQSSKYFVDLVSIEEMYWDKDMNAVFVRTIALGKDDSHCGYGISISFDQYRGRFRLLADSRSSFYDFKTIFKEIRNVLPNGGDFFSLVGTVADYEYRLDSEISAHHKAIEKIKYLEALLFVKEYEEKQKADNLPF